MRYDYDLVIRRGRIVDGSGGAPFDGDLAVSGGLIAQVGAVEGRGREEIDAAGAIVTPGFVDVHTHYDGQATWEHRMRPSSDHGVTTVVMGNCGVGFAPCRPESRDDLVRVMEGVEDIPEVVMTEGVPWAWETFPEYLDFLAGREFDVDLAAQLPHSCLRVYVMGARGVGHEPPTPDDLARMRALTCEAVRAGALGVSTSRNLNHRTKAGDLAPSVPTEEQELLALADGLHDAGAGVLQLIPNTDVEAAAEFGVIRRAAKRAGRPLSFTLLEMGSDPAAWRQFVAGMEAARGDGLPIKAQVLVRPVGIFMGLDLSLHPFVMHPSYRAIEKLPLDRRVEIMRDPAFRARILAEQPEVGDNPSLNRLVTRQKIFYLGDPPNYDPPLDQSLPAQAERLGVSLHELVYDQLLRDDGKAILYAPGSNFVQNDLGAVHEMMGRDDTILALGDGGAHYGMICDASWTTYTLLRWVRDAPSGQRFALPWAVRAMSCVPAEAVGLHDRGRLAPGLKADINVIDLDRLKLHGPEVVHDLPAGGHRLRQVSEGYRATIVSGAVTYREGAATGALPGRLVRSAPTAG